MAWAPPRCGTSSSATAGEVRPGTLGKVVPGFEVKACDEDGDEVPTGEVGRLWVRGESFGPGYWEDPGGPRRPSGESGSSVGT